MMDLRSIRALAEEAAKDAASKKLQPYVVFDEAEVERLEDARLPFPFLGTYVPSGWEVVDSLFCDSSGFGAEDEPALTKHALLEKVRERLADKDTFGYAITQAGQFQAYVGVYRRVAEVPVPQRRDRKDVWPKGEKGAAGVR